MMKSIDSTDSTRNPLSFTHRELSGKFVESIESVDFEEKPSSLVVERKHLVCLREMYTNWASWCEVRIKQIDEVVLK